MVRFRSKAFQWLVCGVITALVAQPLWAATIRVQSDRNPVAMNESFRLTFEAEGRVDDDPDFKLLEQDFEIRHRSQGTSMQIINGEVSQSQQWTVVLMPRRSGRLVVPPIPFGKDMSQSLVIGVTDAAAPSAETQNSALFIEVSAEPGEAYVQSQVIYRAKLFRAVNVANATLSEPVISGIDAVVEKLGDDREYETTRDGRRFVVLERSYAIFPQQSGALTIAPLTFEGQVVNRARGMFDVFEQGGPIRRVRSAEVAIDVKAVPAAENRQQWLPAREVRLVEEWPEGVDLSQPVSAGEPLTWTLTLIADGLTAAQLPAVTPQMPDGMKAYPDQARQLNDKKQDTLIGVRQEKIALIPTEAGEYLLPAVEVPWWNSVSGKREIARLPSRTLQVKAAAQAGNIVGGSDAATDESMTTAIASSDVAALQQGEGRWRIVSGVLGLGWLMTAVAWWLTRRTGRADGGRNLGIDEAGAGINEVKKAMQAACRSNDPLAAKDALLAWGAVRWPLAPPTSLGELARRVNGPLSSEIEALNRRLYRAPLLAARDWDGDALWNHFMHELSLPAQPSNAEQSVLAPMYP